MRRGQEDVDEFLTTVLANIDGYWTETLRPNGLPEPRVSLRVGPAGPEAERVRRAGGRRRRVLLPGRRHDLRLPAVRRRPLRTACCAGCPASGGSGARPATSRSRTCSRTSTRTTSSRSSASSTRRGATAGRSSCRPTAWRARGATRSTSEGLLQPGDIEEAIGTALAVGDFDVGNAQHHGTPERAPRRVAAGFESGEPSKCVLSAE